MQQTERLQTGQQSVLEAAIINHVKENSAHDEAEFLELLYRNALEGSELSQYTGTDLARAFEKLQTLRDFLIEMESAALIELKELDELG